MTIEYSPLKQVSKPVEEYAHLRERCPVHRLDDWGPPLFTLSRYEDVRAVVRDPRRWSSRFGQGPWRTTEPGIRTDPPEHTAYRRAINNTLSAQVLPAHAERIRATVEQAVSDLPSSRFDLLDDLASVVAFKVFAPFLGMTETETRALWIPTFEMLGSPESASPDTTVNFEARKSEAAWQRAHELLAPCIQRSRSPFRDMPSRAQDLIAALVDGRDHLGRPFPDDAIVQVVMLVLFGAIHTTATLLTNSVLRLLEDRARWAAVCANPTLAATAIEESARLDPPVPGIYRTTTLPICLHGVEIPSDAKVRPLFAAANRDPIVFTDPDSYRLDRDPAELARQHFSFGQGVHLCAGAPLARLEGRTFLLVLTERLPGLQEGPVPRWWAERDTITLTRPHRLAPVTARPVWSSRTPEPTLAVGGLASP